MIEKSRKYDDLEEQISKFYPDEPNEDEEYDEGLIGIGEIAARSFGFL